MPLRPFQNRLPAIDAGAYIDPAAVLIGDVTVGADSSVWPLAVLRGDVNSIRIGRRSNIQDLSMLHVAHKTDAKPAGSPLLIGDDVTVGHRVTLHGCTIGSRGLGGGGSTVLDDAVIEDDVIIGAGSLVPPRKRLESGYLYMGRPAKAVRPLTDAEKEHLRYSAAHYARLAAQYLAEARS